MTIDAPTNFHLILPAEIAGPLVDEGLAEWHIVEQRSTAEIFDLAVAVGASLGPPVAVTVAKTAAAETSRRLVRLLIEKWRSKRGETKLTVEVRTRPGKMSMKVEITGSNDREATQLVLQALSDPSSPASTAD